MTVVWLRVRAPFAAYRPLQAGVYRTTAPVMPPSAAYGLILNLAGLEMRSPAPTPITTTRPDLPALRLAIGALRTPGVSSLYQQLHSYPVGGSGKDTLAPRTHGAKYWIVPIRRELLVDLDVQVGIQTDDTFARRLREGLAGRLDVARYGLPFAGDNSFLFDRIEILPDPMPCRWYEALPEDSPPRPGTCRLPVVIDRESSSRTRTSILAPTSEASAVPGEAAWVWVPRSPGE